MTNVIDEFNIALGLQKTGISDIVKITSGAHPKDPRAVPLDLINRRAHLVAFVAHPPPLAVSADLFTFFVRLTTNPLVVNDR